jgi:hypothetical protein
VLVGEPPWAFEFRTESETLREVALDRSNLLHVSTKA